MFLRNAWYAAAFDHELARTPLARTVLNEPIVLFRRADGRPVALEDRCCHRSLPLSLGKVMGDELQCGYHGLVFDFSGRCVRVPGQSAVPPGAAVRAYPCVERWQWIWIWTGAPALADESLIPNWWWMDHPDWEVVKGRMLHVKCNYELIVDNLLDGSHVSFVHGATIGTAAVAEIPPKSERLGDDGIRVTRWVLDRPPPEMFRAVSGLSGPVDRWQICDAHVPSYVVFDAGCGPAGACALDGDRSTGVEWRSLNAIVPETATSTWYSYAHPRRFAPGDGRISDLYRDFMGRTFDEDVVILEAQQRSLDRTDAASSIDINVDGPSLLVRRMLRARIAAERTHEAALA